MNFSQRPGSPGPGACLAVLRRRWAIVLNLAALGLFAAAVYVTAVPQVFTATASVAGVMPRSGGIMLLPVQIPAPYGGAPPARSVRVARIAGQMLHSNLSPLALSKKVTVTMRPDSAVLEFTCSASTAAGAAACANAFAAAYLKDRSDSASAAINQRIAPLKSQVNGGAVVARAQPPDKPSGPDKMRVLPGGLAAGLLLGLIAALLVDRRDRWMYGDGEAEPYRE